MKKNLYRFFGCLFVIFLSLFLSPGPVFAQTGSPSSFPDRIVLNATPDPTTSVAVTWRTDTLAHQGICELQPASSTKIKPAESKKFQAKTTTCRYPQPDKTTVVVNQHSCIITGLIPGKKYIYRVGDENHWSEWFGVEPASENGNKYSFIYFGDPQVGLKSEWSRVVRSAYQKCPECCFMLYGGDIINRAGVDTEWADWFGAGSFIFSTVPQIMTPGNHDYAHLKPALYWNGQFTPPANGPAGLKGTCFFVDYPDLRLISIDSAAGSELEDEKGYEMTVQKSWLDSVLSTNSRKWVVLVTHLPFYSTSATRDNPQLRKNFQPILEKYKVDLVLTGHDHSYGRGTKSDNPSVKPSVVYVVSVSGPKLYQGGIKNWTTKSGSDTQLYQVISVDRNELSYKSYAVTGELFDEFLISDKGNHKKKFRDLNPSGTNKNMLE